MPTKRKKIPRNIVPDMPAGLRTYIETGVMPERGEEGLLACFRFYRPEWERVRDAIVAAWIEEHPGTRPWAWWEWDAPTKLVNANPDAAKDRRRKVSGSGEKTAGVYGFGHRGFYDVIPDDPPQVESEAGYLLRHGLLEPEEKARLQVADYSPVEGYWDPEDTLGSPTGLGVLGGGDDPA